MQGRLAKPFTGLLLLLLLGCDAVPETNQTEPGGPTLGSRFDPTATGTIRGQVTWDGDLPVVPPYPILPLPLGNGLMPGNTSWPNPNAPVIDRATHSVAGAVVFLRHVDLACSRPWDLEPVQIEIRDSQVRVQQGSRTSKIGFVRRGAAITLVSREPSLHLLHADGAAFFTLPFPEPNQPLQRRLTQSGIVELTSASAYFWMRGYLFVADHPYYTCTAADGRFALNDVPPGTYELVCWHPNWHEARRDLDPELGMVLRLAYRPAVELRRSLTVQSGVTSAADFSLNATLFAK